jgi:hypothetical protein
VSRALLIFIAFGSTTAVSLGTACATTDACLTWEGVWVAPWTDANDPACGEACDEDAEMASDRLCSTVGDEGCGLSADTTDSFELRMPSPTREDRPGPRCLRPGPECSPGGGSPASGALVAGLLIIPADIEFPRRAAGTLPGAPAPMTLHVAIERPTGPDAPPPRR